MNKEDIIYQIRKKRSFLCVGLDTDLQKIPEHLLELEDPIFEFNKRIIDVTHDLSVAYKFNLAFYESLGISGWESLIRTVEYVPENIFLIADAKRGDIGNTSKMYAKAFFQEMKFHAITLSPYMGSDSIQPFLEFKNKWAILLGLTSNKGALDLQKIEDHNNIPLFHHVLKKSKKWGSDENMMYVIGATRSDDLVQVRNILPDHFLLVPGVGSQGGSLDDVVKHGMNKDCGLLVNSSRGIIYAGSDKNFDDEARKEAASLQQMMSDYLP